MNILALQVFDERTSLAMCCLLVTVFFVVIGRWLLRNARNSTTGAKRFGLRFSAALVFSGSMAALIYAIVVALGVA